MPRLFVGNFDFESTLTTGSGAARPPALRRIVAELAHVWIAAAEAGDVLWCPEPIDPNLFDRLHDQGLPRVRCVSEMADVPAGLVLVPWGWTDEMIHWGGLVGAKIDAPPLDAVKTVNSRRWSHRLEQEWGIGLPGASEAESLAGVLDAIDRLPSPHAGWIVKAEFSNSSRERFLHRSNRQQTINDNISDSAIPALRDFPIVDHKGTAREPVGFRQPFDRDALIAWAQRRLDMGQALFVEPWVERLDEVGVQLAVPRNGAPRVEGVTRLLVDEAGHYRGSEFTPALDDNPQWEDAARACLEVARAVQETGYFGPLGIDAMRYRDVSGETRLRPIQDINARWTMGRLSLGLRRLLGPSERGIWLHGPSVAAARDQTTESDVPVRKIDTSPESIGGQPVRLRSTIHIYDPS